MMADPIRSSMGRGGDQSLKEFCVDLSDSMSDIIVMKSDRTMNVFDDECV
ncbi:hypothetical protein BJB45_14015 [Halomonas huangheensis]|uniref:Uncharacterized protein n=1 Tax=Halomonas huangheensis TaxID=1178482 RepID=W1N8K0_9GAMM|nr:hypothetical protein BJB45_14015 [Halomonas huangheensis]